ncbi:hypothetical protein HK099_008031 [Clydaea vesicula]|uniref:Uncharacterized protein n=1 Tax=Clydaea vesicula TaxID=447962 RepID=A0AAD5XXR8_9FUNG|nr:hypothetical protein HK099_008031 [Clydaea vesicula]
MSNSAINPAVTAISTSSQNNEIDCQKCSNQFNCINFINSGGSSLSQFTNFTEVYKNCLCFNDTNQTLNKTLIKESEKCSKLANCSTFNATSLLQISQAQPLKLVCENAIIPAFVFSILPNINNVKVIKTATTTYTSDTTFSPATEKPNIEHSDSTTILSPVFTVIVTFSVASTILLLILNILRSIVKKKSLQFDTSTSTFQDPLAFAIEESARISNLQQYPIPPPSYRESILECPPPPSLTETPTSNSTVSTNVIEASPKLSSEYVGCSVHRQVCPVSCLKPNNAVVPINIGTSNA